MCISAPIISYSNTHQHPGYDIPHDPTSKCCTCCVISKKYIILELLWELGNIIPLIFTTAIIGEIEEEINDFYSENSLDRNFIPDRINLAMNLIMAT